MRFILNSNAEFTVVSKKGKNIDDKQAFVEKISMALDEMFSDGTMTRIENMFFKSQQP